MKKPRRKKVQADIESGILIKSARRCPLCFHLKGDLEEKNGQIAHLDHDRTNNDEDNLAFMCMSHHSDYDTTTSQHKNYTLSEVKNLRDRLYGEIAKGSHHGTARDGGYRSQEGALAIRVMFVRAVTVESDQVTEKVHGEIRASLTNTGQQPVYPIAFSIQYERITFSIGPLSPTFPKKLEPGAYGGLSLPAVVGYGAIKNVWAEDSLERHYYLSSGELATLIEQHQDFVNEDHPST